MAIFWVWGMYKFDISGLAGETILSATFNWYLNSHNLTLDQGVPLWRAQSANGTDDQDWTTADAVAKLYDNICEYTRTNESFLDRLVFGAASAAGQFYQWDIATGLQAAIDAGDSALTMVASRDTTQGSGTKSKGGAGDVQGPISRGGSTEQTGWATSDDATPANRPYIEYELAPSSGERWLRVRRRSGRMPGRRN